MNDMQVQCFLETVNTRSYTKAAEKLFLSQPTVSRYVAGLENDLSCKLLKRTTKKVELTEAGEKYYQLFSSWQIELESIKHEIAEISELNTYKIKIGYLEGWFIPKSLSDFCAKFSEKYPEIGTELVCLGFDELMEELTKNHVDVVIMVENPCMRNRDFQYKEVARVQKTLLYPRSHPLAGAEGLSLEDFKNDIFYVLKEENGYAVKYTKKLCARYQFVPEIREVKNIETIFANVQNGNGVAIHDEWGQGCSKDYFEALPMDIFGTVYLIWKRQNVIKEVELFIENIQLT